MAQIDRILDRYDLATLEAAVIRRRAREKKLLASLDRQRRRIEAQLRTLNASAPTGRGAPKPVRKPNARRLNDISLAEAMIRVMAPRKDPIHYKELTETVVKRGLYRTKSKNLLSTVAVTLKRDKRFRKVEPGMYALKG